MWGNPREREILLFSFRKVHISNNNTFSSQEKNHLQHKTVPPKSALKFVPQSVQLYGFAEIGTSKFVPKNRLLYLLLYDRPPSENSPKNCLENVPPLASILCPSLLLYDLYGSVQYDLSQQKHNNTQNKNSSLGFVP
jgi:hypothetical protein